MALIETEFDEIYVHNIYLLFNSLNDKNSVGLV